MNESIVDSVGQCKTVQDGVSCISSVSQSGEIDESKRFVAVLRKGKRVPGVYVRAGFFYARFKDPLSGKWVWRKAPDQSVDGALRIVRESKAAGGSLRAGRFMEALDGVRARRACCTMQQLCDAYSKVAMEQYRLLGKPGLNTIRNSVRSAGRVVEECGSNLDDLSVDEFPAFVKAWALKKIKNGANVYSIHSMANQAKSLFSGWALQGYGEMRLNVPDGLLKTWPKIAPPATRYKLPPLELRNRTIEAGNAEIKAGSNIGLVFILAFYAGMAAIDIARAEWSWVRGGKVVYERHKTHSRAEPPIPPEIVAALESWSGRDKRGFIVPGDSMTARARIVGGEFSVWMRGIGWDGEVYGKAAHELRKLAGSYWLTECGLSWASKWLGDTEATAAKFYCDLLPEQSPVPRNMFSGGASVD